MYKKKVNMEVFTIIKLPRKDQLKNISIERKKLVIINLLLLVMSMVGVAIFTGAINTPITDPLASFQAPSYIPEGYVGMENNSTTGVDKSFTFADKGNNNYFIVAAVKDTNKSEYSELINEPLSEEMEGMKLTSENITVDGYPVTFKLINMDCMGMQLNIFHATWTCTQTRLKLVATGKIGVNETENIKKMIQSIQCHPTKQKWKIPGI